MLKKRTITEEVERIKNLNKVISELDYSDSDPRSRGSYGYRPGAKFNPNTDYLSDIGARKKKANLQDPTYIPFSDTNKSSEEKLLDINNKEDRSLLSRRIIRGDEIKNATPETIKQIKELYGERQNSWGSERDPEKLQIDLTKPFHIEIFYHLLKQKGTRLPTIPGRSYGSIAYSKTLMKLLSPVKKVGYTHSGIYKFKDNIDIKLDNFIKFITNKRDLIFKEASEGFEMAQKLAKEKKVSFYYK